MQKATKLSLCICTRACKLFTREIQSTVRIHTTLPAHYSNKYSQKHYNSLYDTMRTAHRSSTWWWGHPRRSSLISCLHTTTRILWNVWIEDGKYKATARSWPATTTATRPPALHHRFDGQTGRQKLSYSLTPGCRWEVKMCWETSAASPAQNGKYLPLDWRCCTCHTSWWLYPIGSSPAWQSEFYHHPSIIVQELVFTNP